MGAKSFLEKIGVLEETETPPIVIESESIKSANLKTENVSIPSFIETPQVDVINRIRQKIESVLSNKKKSVNGVDFLSMMQSIEGTKSLISDESSRFKTAILFAKTMNPALNKDEIISSADYYIQALDEVRNDFVSSTDNAKKKIETNRIELAAIQDRMNQLKDEMKDLTVKQASIEKEIAESSKKNEEASSAFDIVYNEIRDKLLKDKDQILQYI